jgi:hypothetical protein
MSLLSRLTQSFGVKKAIGIEDHARRLFYDGKTIVQVEWWLSYCSQYPDLYWARIRVLSDGSAEASFDEVKAYGFANHTFAANFISEDEYWHLESFGDQERKEIGAEGVELSPPHWQEAFRSFEYIGTY